MKMARQSEALNRKILLAGSRLWSATEAFFDHPEIGRLLPEYLFLVHCSMRATVPLMQAAERHARDLAETDPVAARLVPYFQEHCQEEMDHDEWLLEDLAALGIDRASVLGRVPPAEVASLVGAQYYWVSHAHPVALLGWFAVLEGNPPPPEMVVRLRQRTGVPERALRTLYEHAALDPHHRDDLNDLIDSLALRPEHLELMGLSALHVIDQLTRILERVMTLDGSGYLR